jgi:hypothetical protein
MRRSSDADGITHEFCNKLLNVMDPLLQQVANTIMQKGKLGTTIPNGVINLVRPRMISYICPPGG